MPTRQSMRLPESTRSTRRPDRTYYGRARLHQCVGSTAVAICASHVPTNYQQITCKFRTSAPITAAVDDIEFNLNFYCEFWCKKRQRPHHHDALRRWADALMATIKNNSVEAGITGQTATKPRCGSSLKQQRSFWPSFRRTAALT